MVSVAGCAADTEEEPVDDATGAVTAGGRAVTFRTATVDLPAARAAEEAAEVFTSIDELRNHFGESCGWFCTQPFAGRVPFQIASPPGKTAAAVYINKADVPAGRELVIRSVSIGANKKWLRVETCTRPGQSRRYAFAVVEAEGTLPLIWVSAPERGQGLGPCR